MRTSSGWALLVVLAIALQSIRSTVQGEPPVANPPPTAIRLDGDGQPLPPGAKYRLGTRDWRHAGEGRSICYSPDGNRLAFISRHAGVTVLKSETGKKVFSGKLRLNDGSPLETVLSVEYSPDGTELVAYVGQGTAHVFDAGSFTHIRKVQAKLDDRFDIGEGSATYSPDGRFIAIIGGLSYAVLHRESGEQIVSENTASQISGAAFSRDGNRLFIASLKPSLKIWDLSDRRIVGRWSDGDDHFVNGPAIAPDGRTVAVASRDVVLVDATTNEVRHRLKGNDPEDLFMEVAFTADGKLVIAASQEGPVYAWNLADGSRKWKLTSDSWAVRNMALRGDGKQVATSDAGHRIWVWSLESGQLLFNDRPAHDNEVQALVFTPDGSSLVTGGGGRDTNVWDVRTGEHLRNLGKSSNSLAITRDQKLLSSWYGAPQLRIWDWRTGEQVGEWAAPGPRIRTFCLSGDENFVAAMVDTDGFPPGYRYMRLGFPDLQPKGEATFEGYARGCFAVSRDGILAATGATTGIELWDLDKGALAATLPYPGHWSSALTFTKDGRFLLSANSDDSITMWELATMKVARKLEGLDRCPAAIAISPNGRIAATAGAYGGRRFVIGMPHKIYFWDLMTGKLAAELSGHDEDVSALAFSTDGSLLATGLQDTTTLVWEVPGDARANRIAQVPVPKDDVAALWAELSSPSAESGQNAVTRLLHDSQTALALAEKKLQPVVVPSAEIIRSLIKELESDEFEKREAAVTRLAVFGSAITGQLKEAAEKSEAPEVRLRCNELLERASKRLEQSGPMLQQTRAVQLLEWIGTPDAVILLKKLAGGAKEAHQTKEAMTAVSQIK